MQVKFGKTKTLIKFCEILFAEARKFYWYGYQLTRSSDKTSFVVVYVD